MTDAAKYKIADQARQRRLDDFASQLSAVDLRQELAAARLILESSLSEQKPNVGAISNLLTVVGKLAACHQTILERSAQVVTREELALYTRGVIDAVIETLRDLPDANNRIDRIINSIGNLERYEPKPKLLTLE